MLTLSEVKSRDLPESADPPKLRDRPVNVVVEGRNQSTPGVNGDLISNLKVPGGLRVVVGDISDSPTFQTAHLQGWFDERPIRRFWDSRKCSGAYYLWPSPRMADAPGRIVLVGATDPEGATQAIGTLLQILTQDDDRLRSPLTNAIMEAPSAAPKAQRRHLVADSIRQRQTYQLMMDASRALRQVTEHPGPKLAEAFWEMVEPFVTRREDLGFYASSAVDFWGWKLILTWRNAEGLALWTKQQRWLMDNFLLDVARYCTAILTETKYRLRDDRCQIHNHHTWPALTLFWAVRYFRAWCRVRAVECDWLVEEIGQWQRLVDQVFGNLAATYRSFDEGGSGYAYMALEHAYTVSGASDDAYHWIGSGRAKKAADFVIAHVNHLFGCVPHGDSGGLAVGPAAAEILRRAAYHYKDGRYKWVLERLEPAGGKGFLVGDRLLDSIPSTEPTDLLGVGVLRPDTKFYSWTAHPIFADYPLPLQPTAPVSTALDKLVFRTGWAKDSSFLFLDGFGGGCHGHHDTNAICQYLHGDRIVLYDGDALYGQLHYHNTLQIILDGAKAEIPPFASIEANELRDRFALAVTSVKDYGGSDWTRVTVFGFDRTLIVVDVIELRRTGHFDLSLFWHVLGASELHGDALAVEQQGYEFEIISHGPGSLALEDVKHRYESPADNYKFGYGTWRRLRRRMLGRFAAGDRFVFTTLVRPRSGEVNHTKRIHTAGELLIQRGFTRLGRDVLTAPCREARPDSQPRKASPLREKKCNWSLQCTAAVTCLSDCDDEVFVGTSAGEIIRIDGKGDVLGKWHVAGAVESILVAGKWLVAGTRLGKVVRLCMDHDEVLWQYECSPTLRLARPAIPLCFCLARLAGGEREFLIVGSEGWQVIALDEKGAQRWVSDTAARAVLHVLACDVDGDGKDEVFFCSRYHVASLLDSQGARVWKDEAYHDYWRAGPDYRCALIPHIANVRDGDGIPEFLVGDSNGNVHCIGRDGIARWKSSTGESVSAMSILCGCTELLVADSTGHVSVLNAANGEAVEHEVLASPVRKIHRGPGHSRLLHCRDGTLWHRGKGARLRQLGRTEGGESDSALLRTEGILVTIKGDVVKSYGPLT